MRSADLLVQTLESLGVQYLFSLSGNQVMPIYDACIDSNLKIIHVRHESSAVHMADAWGRLTGQPGVVLIAGGPGFANALSATFVAKMSESPVVVLSGHSPIDLIGKGAFQEMPQVEMAKPVSKGSWMVTDPAQIGADLKEAYALAASGRPGPVHLMLPQDLLSLQVDPTDVPSTTVQSTQAEIDGGFFDQTMAAIYAAERPLLLSGPSTMRHPDFPTLVEEFAAAGIPLIGTESPRGINDPSKGRFASLLADCDLLVLMGKKLDFTLKWGQSPAITAGTRLIQVDAEEEMLALSRANGDALNILAQTLGDPIGALQALLNIAQTSPANKEAWVETVNREIGFVPAEWNDLASNSGGPIHPAEVGRAINAYLGEAEESVFISDGGEFGQWMQALVQAKHRVINGKSGSIGNALPFGLAARLAFPNARIVACCGDGAFGFIPFEMDTAVRYDLPFTALIGNDSCWGAEYQIQLRNYGPDRVRDVDLLESDYHEVVKVLGGWGQKVTAAADLDAALRAAEQSGKPACLNVRILGASAPLHS